MSAATPASPDPARPAPADATRSPHTPRTPAATGASFDEALSLAPLGWVAVAGLVVTVWIALLPVDLVLATVVALVVAVVTVVLVLRWTPRVRVHGGELHAGPAHIPLDLLRDPVALEGPALREALGPGLDARAYVCLRGWIRTAVRVDVDDPADPTPYWVVSTRRPAALVAALTRD
ncbi:DUF3093 domain-containing protein [Cellulomonas palmilytica]|uniref:DUF3093 domain-containing protein n=1 Tax=Cellulomonas palmilytica TaxID=2608402 RepID=UPI001F3071D3|nr:DUF3093 domain-containing protein [Cellulomonas palmilytica]UJP39187.1 DUF3093 domain-containing protein [Cellulomonas palmilytica]